MQRERFIEVQKDGEDSKSDVWKEGFKKKDGGDGRREGGEGICRERGRERKLRIDTLSTA